MEQHRLLRAKEVAKLTGLSVSTFYGLIRQNTFPKPLKTSANTVAWRQSDIVGWIETLEEVEIMTNITLDVRRALTKEEQHSSDSIVRLMLDAQTEADRLSQLLESDQQVSKRPMKSTMLHSNALMLPKLFSNVFLALCPALLFFKMKLRSVNVMNGSKQNTSIWLNGEP